MKEIKVFIAGSKSLTIARDAIRSVLQILSNNNAKKVLIRTYTYEEFDTSLSPEGRQKEYNRFIMNEADYVIFVLDGTIGGVTLEEFDVAWKTFTSKNRPGIYVYHKPTATVSKEIQKVIDKINQCGQYYTEYSDIENLKLKVKDSFHHVIGKIDSNNNSILAIVKRRFIEWSKTKQKVSPNSVDIQDIDSDDNSDCPIYTKEELEDILSSLDEFVVKDGIHYSKDYDNLGLKLEVCEENFKELGKINIPEKVEVLKLDESGRYTQYILSVTSIGYCAFEGYPNLTKITIPKTVVEIKDGAFRYCRELRFVNIPNSVKYIGYQAFCGCSSLKSIVLPSETIEFSGGIFEACKSLQDVEFTSVAKFITADVFKGCYSLQSIIVPKGSKGKFTFVSEEEDFYLFSLLKEKEDLDK